MPNKRSRERDNPHLTRLDLIMFPLVVAIIFIHSSFPVYDLMGPAASFIRNFISLGLASIAVPVFFFRSGFLFFYGLEWSTVKYFKKLQNRFVTIVVPYLFWNVIAFVYMIAFFHVAGANTSQFWFIQELMLLVIMTPLFHILHRWSIPTLIVLLAVWLFFDWSLDFPVLSSSLPILFFYAGSVVAVNNKTPFLSDKWGWLFAFTSICLFTVDTVLNPVNQLIHNFGILFGVIGALALTRYLLNVKTWLLPLSGAAFFVFAFHQPLMGRIIGDVIYIFRPNTDFGYLFFYFSVPIVVIGLGLCFFFLLKRFAPGILEILTGDRSFETTKS